MPPPASSEPRRYRGALIGAGGIARQSHLPALRGALRARVDVVALVDTAPGVPPVDGIPLLRDHTALSDLGPLDRKSTRLNSSHSQISYAVFCLKKKKS